MLGVKQYVQATAAWQWYNWTLQRVPKDKKPLRMNFDETSCRLFYEAAPGILGSESVATSAKKGFISQQVTRHQKRGALSLLAVLCDDTTIQSSVPQVIIGNERCLPEGDRQALEESGVLMKNVIVLRRKSAWVTDEVLSQVVAIWGNALRACRLTHQPILLLDVCSTHMGPRFLKACARWDIWLVFVPAKTTWLLQPADTHCFAVFKRYVRQLFEQSLLASSDGVVDIKTIIIHLDRSIRQVFQGRKWSAAFDANGWSWRQQFVREKIIHHCEWTRTSEVGDALPSLDQFLCIFPNSRFIPLADLLNHYKLERPRLVAPPRPRVVGIPSEPVAIGMPWHGRLRSSSALHLQQQACSDSDEASETMPEQAPPLPPPESHPGEQLPATDEQAVPTDRPRFPVGRLLRRPRSFRPSTPSASSHGPDVSRPAKAPRTASP